LSASCDTIALRLFADDIRGSSQRMRRCILLVTCNALGVPLSSRDDKIVYSTGIGRIKQKPAHASAVARGDGVVRVRRETGGRGGKTVTAIHGVPLAGDALQKLAGDLKRLCGSGGSAKDGVIEIQGDQRDKVVAALEQRGYTVKRAGG
jgi:translation initiation factor 1